MPATVHKIYVGDQMSKYYKKRKMLIIISNLLLITII